MRHYDFTFDFVLKLLSTPNNTHREPVLQVTRGGSGTKREHQDASEEEWSSLGSRGSSAVRENPAT